MLSYLVLDSSILIFYERKGKLEDFLWQKKKANYKVIIPKAIVQEIVDEPIGFAEKIVKPYYRGNMNAAIQDLLQKPLQNKTSSSPTSHISKTLRFSAKAKLLSLIGWL
jgi:hypothetical protein